MSSKILAQGAEAKIILDETKKQIIKDRTSKSYRLKELDEKIRRLRTRSEAKLLEKASKIINVPVPINANNQQLKKEMITMPFINGKKLSENLNSFNLKEQKQIMKQIGQDVAKLHDADIIHGDLTTSNMIYVDNKDNNKNINNKPEKIVELRNKKIQISPINNFFLGWVSEIAKDKFDLSITERDRELGGGNFQIFFIDFGLGFISHRIEDKAVDLHLLKQALEAKHFSGWEKLFEEFLNGYKNSLAPIGSPLLILS